MRIVYCADCGYDEQAVAVARDLLAAFGHSLASVSLVPWDEGTFDVSVDGALVHSMTRDGGFPTADAVRAAVRERIAAAKEA